LKITYFASIVLLLCQLFWSGLTLAQKADHSTNGLELTPRGDLHVLVIVVRYPDQEVMKSRKWPDSSEPGMLPEFLIGRNNQLFSQSRRRIERRKDHNLSDYLYAMSDGQFVVTGEAFPVQVPVSFIPERGGNFYSRQQAMNKEAIEWITANYPDFDWSKFDQRTNRSNYRTDNSQSEPDSVLDYVFFLHRAPGSNGISSACNISIPNSPYRISGGHTGIKSYSDAEHNWLFFLHEFAHNLYNAPHFGGANNSDGQRFYTQNGWGLMQPWNPPWFTPLAWESWWLGWIEPQTLRRAGTYQLRDMVTGRDAIRIQLPGTDQYLWLENHQKIDPWDQKLFYTGEGALSPDFTPTAPGIYAYVVSEQGSDRTKPRLNPFNKAQVNFIKWYNGEGNWDFEVLPYRMKEGKGARFPAFRRVALNPMVGQNDFQQIRYDKDGDGELAISFRHGNLDRRRQEQAFIMVEEREGRLIHSGNVVGDERDALVTNSEIGLSGLFTALPWNTYIRKEQRFPDYLINGLTIRVGEKDEDGTYEVEVDFNDWEVKTDQRWCGPLRLDASTGTESLIIQKGITLTLDLSGTPDRELPHPLTETLSNPTVLTIGERRSMILKPGATLIVQNYSELVIEEGGMLIVEKGANLLVKETGFISPESEQRIVRR